jgi:hypothetical protein
MHITRAFPVSAHSSNDLEKVKKDGRLRFKKQSGSYYGANNPQGIRAATARMLTGQVIKVSGGHAL